ncbi:hypothetical protein OUZ56_006429 [Daphnia magna]|uniref:Uncharacterized protein n=1 Tax=Daphnia magna TaxID=35525 RepID=A0ABQ9YVL7_9CRUS|nr:hypothetical protein OUZ56_006429 [Daphnia magna]
MLVVTESLVCPPAAASHLLFSLIRSFSPSILVNELKMKLTNKKTMNLAVDVSMMKFHTLSSLKFVDQRTFNSNIC